MGSIVMAHGNKIIRRMGIGIWEKVFDIYMHPRYSFTLYISQAQKCPLPKQDQTSKRTFYLAEIKWLYAMYQHDQHMMEDSVQPLLLRPIPAQSQNLQLRVNLNQLLFCFSALALAIRFWTSSFVRILTASLEKT